ncbi:MAG: hypothetical protein KDI03_22720, partial [Anaerolineae bacterium]|nr:hypothetical protein [Anaerolineae bacterium]
AVTQFNLGHVYLTLPAIRDLDAAEAVTQFNLGHVYLTLPAIRDLDAAEAVTQFNLGHVYLTLPAIRDLDAAEAAYRRALSLYASEDKLYQAGAIKQIGMVHHERFNEARQHGQPDDVLLRHAQAAEQHYQQALALCPPSALADLGPMHNQLGILYKNVGQIEPAREHYERDVHVCEQTGDRFGAGQTRYNLALMYLDAAGREAAPSRRRDLLRRARAYVEASLRDFQHFQGRAAAEEARAQRLIEIIERELGE